MSITAEEILAEIGPVQEILDEHDGVVNVIDTTGWQHHALAGRWMQWLLVHAHDGDAKSLMLKKLEYVNDVIFVNGELQNTWTFIDQKMAKEAEEGANNTDDDGELQGEIV